MGAQLQKHTVPTGYLFTDHYSKGQLETLIKSLVLDTWAGRKAVTGEWVNNYAR